jgi:predicted nucleic acid-binding protein
MLRKAGTDEDRLKQLIRSFYHPYEVVMLEESVLLAASGLRQRYSLSYWDSLIVATEQAADATVLYSEDMPDGQIIDGRLVIVNPFQSD